MNLAIKNSATLAPGPIKKKSIKVANRERMSIEPFKTSFRNEYLSRSEVALAEI